MLSGLFHSFSLSHFPSLILFSFIPLIPLSSMPFIPLIPLILLPLTQYIITHSAHSPHLAQLISIHSVHSHSFLSFHSFSFIPFIPLIQLILFPFTQFIRIHLDSFSLIQLVFIHSPLSHSLRIIISTHTFSYSFYTFLLYPLILVHLGSFPLIQLILIYSANSDLFRQFLFIWAHFILKNSTNSHLFLSFIPLILIHSFHSLSFLSFSLIPLILFLSFSLITLILINSTHQLGLILTTQPIFCLPRILLIPDFPQSFRRVNWSDIVKIKNLFLKQNNIFTSLINQTRAIYIWMFRPPPPHSIY